MRRESTWGNVKEAEVVIISTLIIMFFYILNIIYVRFIA